MFTNHLFFIKGTNYHLYTVCPRSRDSFNIVIYYTKWVTTSWTYSISGYIESTSFNKKLLENKKLRSPKLKCRFFRSSKSAQGVYMIPFTDVTGREGFRTFHSLFMEGWKNFQSFEYESRSLNRIVIKGLKKGHS